MKNQTEKTYCSHCGELIDTDDYELINGSIVCSDCVEMHTVVCDHCNERIFISASIQDDDISLCQSCYDEYYHTCENCGRIIHSNSTNWRGDYPYCDSCYDDFSDEIEEYSYKPEPIFYGKGKRFFGVELEIDCGGKDDDNARILKQIANSRGEHMYVKADGSLSEEGLELVTHPCNLDYHKNNMEWEAIMKRAISMGYRSHQTSTCGLHIHVNRDCFGEDRDTQDEVISRILFFVETHWAELLRFSRRSEYSINRWAARYGYEKTGREILDKAKKGCQGRYAAVNLCNYSTIEFRLFRGTLKHNTLIAALELVNAICDLAISLTDEGIANMSWSEFVGTLTEPELIQYLKERKLYVNDDIETQEDM